MSILLGGFKMNVYLTKTGSSKLNRWVLAIGKDTLNVAAVISEATDSLEEDVLTLLVDS